jgi:hypothetical protein
VGALFDAALLTWSTPFTLAVSGPIGEAFDSPQVAMNAGGDIAVVWRKFFLATPGPIQARIYHAATKTWTPSLEHAPVDLSLPGAGQPQVGISMFGNALAVWGINDAVEARVYNATTKSWTSTSTLSTTSQSVLPQFSMSSAGNGFVIWGNFSLGKVIQAVTNYNLCPIPVSPFNFLGKLKKKDYLHQTTYLLTLSWEASPSPNVVKYRIYKDKDVVVEFIVEKGSQMHVCFPSQGEGETLDVVAVSDDDIESERIPLGIER